MNKNNNTVCSGNSSNEKIPNSNNSHVPLVQADKRSSSKSYNNLNRKRSHKNIYNYYSSQPNDHKRNHSYARHNQFGWHNNNNNNNNSSNSNRHWTNHSRNGHYYNGDDDKHYDRPHYNYHRKKKNYFRENENIFFKSKCYSNNGTELINQFNQQDSWTTFCESVISNATCVSSSLLQFSGIKQDNQFTNHNNSNVLPFEHQIITQAHNQDQQSWSLNLMNSSEYPDNFQEYQKDSNNSENNSDQILATKLKQEEITIKNENNDDAPKISLIPLSLLIKEEYIPDCSEKNSSESQQIDVHLPTTTKNPVNLTQNKDPDKVLKRLLNRIVKMDKTDIKNVINNPTPKFDAALKIHARKKLREEIRKQLKNMNLTTATSNNKVNENLFEPDESIDCGQIPETILNEISKSLGIELLTEAGLHEENYLSDIDATTLLSAEGLMTTTTATTTLSVSSSSLSSSAISTSSIQPSTQENNLVNSVAGAEKEIITPPFSSASLLTTISTPNDELTDPITRNKNFEIVESTSLDKVPKKVSDRKCSKDEIKTKKGKSNEITEVYLGNSSSSSCSDDDSSSSDSESSSSSTDSSNSNKSTNNNGNDSSGSNSSGLASIKRTKRKRILEDNVITHFNTLILPIMPPKEYEKFNKKSFKNNVEKLLFILNYCLKQAGDDELTITNYRKQILKRNLKSKNNEDVIEFLLKKIKDIFDANKLKKKTANTKTQKESSKNCTTSKENNNKNKKATSSTVKRKSLNEKHINESVDSVSDSFEKPSKNASNHNKTSLSKRKHFSKSKHSNDKNNIKSSENTISTVNGYDNNSKSDNSKNSKSSSTKKIFQMRCNIVNRSKDGDCKPFREDSFHSNKEILNDHKGINNCREKTPSPLAVEVRNVSSAATITPAINNNDGCIERIDDKYRKETNEIVQLNADIVDNEKIEIKINGNEDSQNEEATTDNTNSTNLQTFPKQNDKILIEESAQKTNSKTESSLINEENHLSSDFHELNKMQRSWKSPGEKKCIQLTNSSAQNDQNLNENNNNSNLNNNEQLEENTVNPSSISNSFNSNSNLSNFSELDFQLSFPSNLNDQSESLRLISLFHQNKLSEAVFNNLKEIDLKLMELHKRKMYVEEMILKLQKDKMQLDLTAMQLKNEKFLIINAALSNNNSFNACLNSNQLQSHLNVKSEPITTIPTTSATVATPTIVVSGSNATDLMTSMLSQMAQNAEKNSIQHFSSPKLNQRKRKIIQKEITSENMKKIKKNCQQSLKDSSPNSNGDNNSNLNLNFVKITRSNDVQKLKSKQIEENFSNEKQSKSNSKKVTSDTGKVKSNENLIVDNNRNLERERDTKTYKNHDDDFDESSSDEDVYEENDDQQQTIKNDSNDELKISNGLFENSKFPITQIRIVHNFVIAASEDGNIYKFCLKTRKLISKFSKHTEAVTEICIYCDNFIYSISLDGYLKKTSLENFGLELQSKNLQEPLQCIDLQWNMAFIGSRWGNVFMYNAKNNKLSESLLCSVGSAIMAIKATKEGARKILIISSKGNQINFRDATSGLLLRRIQIPDNLNIYSILLDGDLLYCGSNKNEIHTFNFTTGAKVDIFICGNGAVSMKLYKGKLIFVGCYDGFVYVLDKFTGSQIGRFPGAGKMILSLDIIGEKLITSSKENCMEIRDIPRYISALLK